MKKALFNLTVILLLTGLFTPLAVEASTITVDGNFSDWSGVTAIGTDASGDASGDIVDWTTLWATSQNGALYVSYQTTSNIDFASNAWRYAIYIDKDSNASTGYRGMDGSFLIGAEYLIEGETLLRYTGDGTGWSWSLVSSLSYSFAANRLEMAIPESNLGLGANYTVTIMLFGNNPTTPDYAKNDKSGFVYSLGTGVAAIDSSSDYLWYFGDWNTDNGVNEVEEAKDFRFVLIHPTNCDITPAQIAEVKKGNDGILGTSDDVFFVGYLSVGEDIKTDKDHNFPPDAGDGTGPVYYDSQTDTIVHQNNGYASYYLDDVDKDGLPDRNWQYKGCYANPGDPAYQAVLKTGAKTQNGFAGVDELYNVYGCDGIMLDTIDVVNPIAWGFPFYFEWTAPGLTNFISNLRQWYPDKKILLNRGLVYYDPNQKRMDGHRYLKEWSPGSYVDMVLFEGYYWPGDEVRNRYYWAPRLNAEADRPDGFTVIGLDYVGDASIAVDGQFNDWVVWGAEREGVEKLDNALIWSKGVNTPDELADDVSIPAIDMIDMWAANEAVNDNICFKVKFKGAVNLANYDYYIFLDTDKNKDTGYWRVYGSASGADYMIFDGDNQYLHLYKYVGTDNTSWSWQWLGFIPFAIGNDEGVNNAIEMRILKTDIGESDSFDEALDVTFVADQKTPTYIADSAPDDLTVDYYEYLFRTKRLAISETVKEQGWLEYVIPLADGGEFQPIDYTAYNNHPAVDSQPPIWDSTAASAGAKAPSQPVSRVGIQEAEPSDGSVTIRWDVARDQTRPVNYNIYYSTTTPINFTAATKISHADKSAAGRNYYNGTGLREDFPASDSTHGFYSKRVGEGVYPYEYTITGLTNGQTYYFAVRAEDSFATPHEDTNTVELAAVPFSPRVCAINIDGNFNDWQDAKQLDFSPGEVENDAGFPPELDIMDIWATNSACTLYMKLKFKSTIDMANSSYDILLDADGNNTTGYAGVHIPTYPWAVGADYLIQDGAIYKHSPVNGYRVWNWEFIGNIPYAIGNDGGVQNAIEMYIPRLPLEGTVPNSYKILVRSDRVVGQEEHIYDYAPNDPFSHAYTYDITGLVIDGYFEDWTPWGKYPDPTGDISAGDIVDWQNFIATRQLGKFYLYYRTASDIDFANNAWRYAVYLDTDNNPSTGFRWFDGSFQIGAEYLIEGSALHQYTGNGTSWSWNVVSSVDYAYTGNTMEMAIADTDLGLDEESAITALFVGNNPITIDYIRDDKSGVCLWAPWMYGSSPRYFF